MLQAADRSPRCLQTLSRLSHVLSVNLHSSVKSTGRQWQICQSWCSLANVMCEPVSLHLPFCFAADTSEFPHCGTTKGYFHSKNNSNCYVVNQNKLCFIFRDFI
ncbi:hypothetical protein AMECASPLE_034381 [Ameca splendens]|uniref:Uncharacterized protein n=1 Tax=Ameca splendens TaxID=208324 RepID=A0ABV0YIK4_9TELE